MTIWEQLAECVDALAEPLSAPEILSWFRRHHPETKESSIRAHIQAATSNASDHSKAPTFANRTPLLTRVGHGSYVRYAGADDVRRQVRRAQGITRDEPVVVGHVMPSNGTGPGVDLVLVGCCKAKASTPRAAKDLFQGAGFRGGAALADASGLPWHILSARWGLIDPEEVLAPYDLYLVEQSADYRRVWGEWVIMQLAARHTLRGRCVEVHAGAAYVAPLRSPAERVGLRLLTPLEGLTRGQRLAWYAARAASRRDVPMKGQGVDRAVATSVVGAIAYLRDPANAVGTDGLATVGDGLKSPGLYIWWVDAAGATELSEGLGCPVSAGLMYLGQAGATKWPSGARSDNTLGGRITGMHLAGNRRMSTLRRSLAGVLSSARGVPITEADLTIWMQTHLRVIAWPASDPDGLHALEAQVLAAIDPPLNLAHMAPTPLRTELSRLRKEP